MEELNKSLKETFSNQSSYCYPNTNVLINKLGLTDSKELEVTEAAISTYKLSQLHENDYFNTFDIDHYLSIHKFLFDQIYDFAGCIRKENITKSNLPYSSSITPFCRPEFIYSYLKKNIDELYSKSLKWNNKQDMVRDLAYYYSEINITHPFREGNGRCQREFFRELVLNNHLPYVLDYTKVEDHELIIKASIVSSLTANTSLLEIFFNTCLIEKELEKQL